MAALQVRLQKGQETGGFLLSRGEKMVPGLNKGSRYADAVADHENFAGSLFSGFGNTVYQVPTPFSAGYSFWGALQSLVYYLVFLTAMVLSAIFAIGKLMSESDTFDNKGHTPTGNADAKANGCNGAEDGSCHKYHQFDSHISTLLYFMAILPFIAIAVSLIWYGCWYMPMSSAHGLNATIGTLYYAHLFIIFASNTILLAWISIGFTTSGDPAASPHADARSNAGQNDVNDDLVVAAFIFNAATLAGSIAFPLTALAMKVVPDPEIVAELEKKKAAADVEASPENPPRV